MLGFYVLLEDPDASVIIIIALPLHSALLQLGFFYSNDLRYIADQPGRWVQSKTQQPIGVVSLVITHVNDSDLLTYLRG